MLSPTQRTLLRALADGVRLTQFITADLDGWLTLEPWSKPPRQTTVDALVRRGYLVRIHPQVGQDTMYVLTDAGRKAAEEQGR